MERFLAPFGHSRCLCDKDLATRLSRFLRDHYERVLPTAVAHRCRICARQRRRRRRSDNDRNNWPHIRCMGWMWAALRPMDAAVCRLPHSQGGEQRRMRRLLRLVTAHGVEWLSVTVGWTCQAKPTSNHMHVEIILTKIHKQYRKCFTCTFWNWGTTMRCFWSTDGERRVLCGACAAPQSSNTSTLRPSAKRSWRSLRPSRLQPRDKHDRRLESPVKRERWQWIVSRVAYRSCA